MNKTDIRKKFGYEIRYSRNINDDAISCLTESADMRRQLLSGGYEGLRDPLKTTLDRLGSVYEYAGDQENAELIRSEIDEL